MSWLKCAQNILSGGTSTGALSHKCSRKGHQQPAARGAMSAPLQSSSSAIEKLNRVDVAQWRCSGHRLTAQIPSISSCCQAALFTRSHLGAGCVSRPQTCVLGWQPAAPFGGRWCAYSILPCQEQAGSFRKKLGLPNTHLLATTQGTATTACHGTLVAALQQPWSMSEAPRSALVQLKYFGRLYHHWAQVLYHELAND